MSEEQDEAALTDRQERPESPALSGISMTSDRSKGDVPDFKDPKPGQERPESPALSGISMTSDRSKGDVPDFKDPKPGQERPESPALSGISMTSDRSKGDVPDFKDPKPGQERPESPALSGISMTSDRSKGDVPDFKDPKPGQERPESPALSGISMTSDRSKGDVPDFKDPKPGQERPESPALSGISMTSDRSKGDVPDFKDPKPGQERPESPALSGISMTSDRSKGDVPDFKDPKPGQERPESPALSGISMTSDRSKGDVPDFKDPKPGQERPESPALSGISMTSDRSKGDVPDFKDPKPGNTSSLGGPEVPLNTSTNASKKRSQQKDQTTEQQKKLIPTLKEIFKKKIPDEDKDHHNQSSTEHIMRENKGEEKFSHVKETADIFKEKRGQKIRTVLTVGEAGIGKSHHAKKFVKEWAKSGNSVVTWIKSLWSGAKDDVVVFLLDVSELNVLKGEKFSLVKLLCNFFPEIRDCEMYEFEKLKVLIVLDGLDALQPALDFKDDISTLSDIHQAASVNELLTNLIRGSLLSFARLWITSRPSPQLPDECVDRWTEIRYKGVKHTLTAVQKKRMIKQLENKLKDNKKPYAEIFEIHEDTDREDKIQSLGALFHDSKEKGAQTVLMKGVPNVGKTYLAWSLMMEWAKGKSNKNIDFVVSFSFHDLNAGQHTSQNMTDLLCQSLNPEKKPGVCNYRECKVLFVLDGLEKCKLPLNFAQNKDLTVMEEAATMDVLLTNLIKRTLFPSAHILIITQPSGADKIPSEYIQKVTECRETLERRRQLIPALQDEYKGTILKRDIDLFKQENTEHIKREQKRSGTSVDDDKDEETVATTVTPVTVSDIFKESKEQKIRNVLTVGVKDIGKTFLVEGFIKDWAKGKSVFSWLADALKRRANNNDVVILLRLSELNSIRQKKISLFGVLNHLYQKTSKLVITNFDQLNVLFILDGLDAFQPALDFENKEALTDVQKSVSVDVLLTNLIRGSLLPSAQLWITSRPEEASKLPVECVDRKTEIRYGDIKDYLTADQKTRMTSQLENKLKGKQKTFTEIFEIHEDKDGEDKIQSLGALFPDSKEKEAQTVLMKGVPHVGKTYLALSHMMEWANGKSNKNIDFVVSFNFHELNAGQQKNQSMTDLLCQSLNPEKKPGVCKYSECKVLFVLDGLEKCKLPLNFAQNKDLTDVEEAALMDVLLTNLIKRTLFPSAHILIITQPSGADKIPSEYIQKVAECRETLERRRQLISTLQEEYKGTILKRDIDLFKQENTEHIKREQKRSGTSVDDDKDEETVATTVTAVTAVSDMFIETKEQKIRNVLTVGVKDIGKTFLVEGFIEEWAKDKSVLSWLADALKRRANNNDVVILLRLSKLNSIRQEKISLFGVLNHLYQKTSKLVITNFDQLNVLFILDGLDAFQPALDFENKEALTDVQKSVSVDVLLTNLIRGSLLPSAQLWITSRPEEASKLPVECVDRKTEIRYKPDLASQWKLKSQLKDQFTHVTTGMGMQKASTTLSDIYTDLYIIEGERGEVNIQSETRQIEGAKFKPEERSIKYDAIFDPAEGKNKDIKSVLTIGMAGIGKSFATMKYMLDWAEEKTHNDIFFMFPLSFRELNLRKDDKHSLEDLIHSFFPGMRTSEIKDYDKYKTLIVLDGFDECRLDLDFIKSDDQTNGSENTICVDVKEKTSVKNLLTNLIKGNLLSKAQVWITSRPAASNTIPADKVDRVTEVRGFNDEQKEEYFKKHFDDKDLAEKILSHVKSSRTLYIMCHIPVFCWLTSKVLEDHVKRKEEGKMPSTLTDMYINFLLLQCRQSKLKYDTDETNEMNSELDSCWNIRNITIVVSLGKLAFEGLKTGDLVFTEETLTDSGIDLTEAAVLSGIFTQIKREGPGLHQQKLFCFVHMSIQEFMAAFYVFYTFNNEGENLLTKSTSTASDFYKTAVDEALRHQNGDWDLFLRFLLGLSLEDNQRLLRALLKKTENNEETNKETIEYIKTKIREENRGADQNFNLFHCLNELNDHSLVEEIKKYLRSETVSFESFTASQWSALTFVLLTSDENLDVFDLKKYRKSEQVLLGMLPVVKVAKTALLSWCELTEESCSGLHSSVLSAPSSNLTKLDLSHNDLLDSGVKFIADGLKSLNCKLEILKLSGCQVTETGCSFLVSALKSNSASSLKELDLSYNHPGETGKAELTAIEEDSDMKLKTLRLEHCGPHRLKPGIKKYDGCLELDENTASKRLVLSEDNQEVKTVKKVEEKVQRPENEERFKRSQVFCGQGQKGLCYWEVEWKGTVGIAVAYKGVGRKWDSRSGLGCNDMSWSLLCSKDGYIPIHGKPSKLITEPFSQKLAIFLNWNAGTLTYYSDTSGELSHIHTFKATFTEPLYPSFWFKKGCVTLCKIDETPLRWSQIKPQQCRIKKEAKPVAPKSTRPRVANLNQTSTARVEVNAKVLKSVVPPVANTEVALTGGQTQEVKSSLEKKDHLSTSQEPITQRRVAQSAAALKTPSGEKRSASTNMQPEKVSGQ